MNAVGGCRAEPGRGLGREETLQEGGDPGVSGLWREPRNHLSDSSEKGTMQTKQ